MSTQAKTEVEAITAAISALKQKRESLARELAGAVAALKLKAVDLVAKKRVLAKCVREQRLAAARDAKAATLAAVLELRRQQKTEDLRARRQATTAANAAARQERKRKLSADAADRAAKRQRGKFVRMACKHSALRFDSVDMGGNAMGAVALRDMFPSEEERGKFCSELIARLALSGRKPMQSVTVYRDTEWHGCRRGDLPAYSADTDEYDSEEEAHTAEIAAELDSFLFD